MSVVRILVLLIALASVPVSADDWELNIYTETYPPFNYLLEGQAKGIAYDLLIAMLEDMDQSHLRDEIEFIPWARGYRLAQTQPNTMLFATARHGERESLFQWVGPIITSTNVLMGKRSLTVLNDELMPSDLAKLKIVAVQNDIGHALLLEHPILSKADIQLVAYPRQAALMLNENRVDLWSYGREAILYIMQEEAINARKYDVVYQLGEPSSLHYAFSLDTPEDTINRFQRSLERMRIPESPGSLSVLDQIAVDYGATDLQLPP